VSQTPEGTASPTLAADYFDGQSAQAHPVQLQLLLGVLHISGEAIALQVPARQVSWPERQRHGARQAYLPGHGMLVGPDAQAWDAWAAASGVRQSLMVHWMQSWRGVMLATVMMVALIAITWVWGVPLAARGVVAMIPPAVDAKLGEGALEQIEQQWLKPSAIPAESQAALRARFDIAARKAWADHALGRAPLPPYQLVFRGTPEHGIGANAFALPGGTIIVTDDMVKLLDDRPDVLMGVLGHELGHLRHRHGMRMLVQATALAGISSLVVGDFSALLAAAPVLLGQAAYSRDAEFEADQDAAHLMRTNGTSPEAFAVLFERMRAQRKDKGKTGSGPLIGLASHPPDEERVKRMTGR
jgi:Zn-dependent protease with chaperone function